MVKLEEDANGCCTASCCHCFWVSFFLCFGSGFGFIALTASMSAQEYPFVDLNGNALRGDTDAWNSNTCYNMKGKIGQDFVQGQEESGYLAAINSNDKTWRLDIDPLCNNSMYRTV